MKLISIIAILSLAWSCSHALWLSGKSPSAPKFPFTHNKPALTNLYNQKISSLQEYRRPLDIPTPLGPPVANLLNKFNVNHRGQAATMQNGDRYLVHKGSDFGKDSQTVVVGADKMSNKWAPFGSATQPGSQSVKLGDLVGAGGSTYKLTSDNCMHAADRMGGCFKQGK